MAVIDKGTSSGMQGSSGKGPIDFGGAGGHLRDRQNALSATDDKYHQQELFDLTCSAKDASNRDKHRRADKDHPQILSRRMWIETYGSGCGRIGNSKQFRFRGQSTRCQPASKGIRQRHKLEQNERDKKRQRQI